MDVLKKMFESKKSGGGVGGGGGHPGDANNCNPKMPRFGDEFRKPVWFDDCESDDELYGGNNNNAGGIGGSQHGLFGFQVFTSPLEMQRHFEQQVDEMMRSLHQFEGEDGAQSALFNDNARDNYLKPGFEDVWAATVPDSTTTAAADSATAAGQRNAPYSAPPPGSAAGADSDLDGEIYADQLHSLLQRISPDLDAFVQRQSRLALKSRAPAVAADPMFGATLPNGGKSSSPRLATSQPGAGGRPLTDEQQVMNLIHGTAEGAQLEQQQQQQSRRRPTAGKNGAGAAMMPAARSGIFEGAFQGPKIFRQSVMSQTVRHPDGTTETRRIVRDADGTTNTTITRTDAEGRTQTTQETTNRGGGGGGGCGFDAKAPPPGGLPPAGTAKAATAGGGGGGGSGAAGAGGAAFADRNIYVTKAGYAMPLNIW